MKNLQRPILVWPVEREVRTTLGYPDVELNLKPKNALCVCDLNSPASF